VSKLVEHREGATRLLVPRASLSKDPPPKVPVFFNPAASLNRDVSVALASASGARTFCDSMAGVGARGVRIANEVGKVEHVALVDLNPAAIRVARRAAALNGVGGECEFSCSDTSAYLSAKGGRDERFECVDVDPFGTPVRQVQAALTATSDGGVLSVTATDTAVLCGVYPKVSLRRYGALPLNNHFHHETGVRILVGYVARQGASLDLGVTPVAAHSTRHYVRVYLRVKVGASEADSTLGRLGHVGWCHVCGRAWRAGGHERECPGCGGRAKIAGPLWDGRLTDEAVLKAGVRAASATGLDLAKRTLSSLVGVDEFPPWSFSIERMCSALKVATVPASVVVERLQDSGRKAMRTPFEKTGIKTDAGVEEMLTSVRQAAGGGAARPRGEPPA
jgi:tRNA (guanine26-N2/guanine27-N2)-dimethyltransferase